MGTFLVGSDKDGNIINIIIPPKATWVGTKVTLGALMSGLDWRYDETNVPVFHGLVGLDGALCDLCNVY
jgi:hypothetical protein